MIITVVPRRQVEMLALRGTTVIITTHYMEEAETLCARVAIMHKGNIVATGSPRRVEEVRRGEKDNA